jgi:hypothetical protein
MKINESNHNENNFNWLICLYCCLFYVIKIYYCPKTLDMHMYDFRLYQTCMEQTQLVS